MDGPICMKQLSAVSESLAESWVLQLVLQHLFQRHHTACFEPCRAETGALGKVALAVIGKRFRKPLPVRSALQQLPASADAGWRTSAYFPTGRERFIANQHTYSYSDQKRRLPANIIAFQFHGRNPESHVPELGSIYIP